MRGFIAACALALVGLALFGIVKVEQERLSHQATANRVHGYAALAGLAATEKRRVAAGQTQTASFFGDGRRITKTLSGLQSMSVGSEAGALTSLQVGYAAALRRATGAHDYAPLAASLPELRGYANARLRDLELAERRSPARTPYEGIGLVAMALLAGLNLLWLLRRGLLSLRPADWDGQDRRVEELQAQARTDSLTQLGNHRAFHADLSEELKRRGATGAHFTLMAVDLDGLKRINDTKGHPAGDAHIKGITACLRRVIGLDGTIYRTGGDEFTVILPNKRNWDALLLANRIDQTTREFAGGRAVSIGLTESTGLEGRQLLVHQADLALYEAKRTKLRAVTYHPGLSGGPLDTALGWGPSRDQRALAAALARAVDAKDIGTRSHSEMVAELSVAVGRRLGITGDRLERLRLAGLLHDVGKIGVADAILQKTGSLDEDERAAMSDHVKIGQSILIAAELPTEADWILHHHERYDGSGYPAGKRGEEIPLEARIISTADAFEAMTGPRPYRESISTVAALAELRRSAKTQFDARCVEALAAVVQNFPDLVNEPSLPAVLDLTLADALARQAS